MATVFDLLCANYGVDRGLGDACAKSFDDDVPYTPALAGSRSPVSTPEKVIAVAREFAADGRKDARAAR